MDRTEIGIMVCIALLIGVLMYTYNQITKQLQAKDIEIHQTCHKFCFKHEGMSHISRNFTTHCICNNGEQVPL